MTDFLKTLILVNAAIAVGFAIFYQLVLSCVVFHISAWWAAIFFLVLYVAFIWQPVRALISNAKQSRSK